MQSQSAIALISATQRGANATSSVAGCCGFLESGIASPHHMPPSDAPNRSIVGALISDMKGAARRMATEQSRAISNGHRLTE